MNTSRVLPRAAATLAMAFLTTAAISAGEATYRYFRFNPTALRGAGTENSIQLSEFEFLRLGSALSVAGVVVTNPGGDNPPAETPPNIIDLNTNTKWLDFNKGPLVFDFGVPVTIDGYTFATANDSDNRDPVGWNFEGSGDGANWTLLDSINNHPTTTARFTYEPDFMLPDALPPVITSFAASPSIILNGETTELSWTTEEGTTIGIDQSVGPVPATGIQSVSPPDNADTTYTLSVTNPTDTVTATAIARTVAGGAANYQYVRFTPLKMRGAGSENSIQLAEFAFFNAGAPVVPVDVFNPGGSSPLAEGPENLIDGDTGTKWLDPSKNPVEFDFPAPVTFDSYSFTTANDFPDRDPVRWIMEGSNDGFDWDLIDNVSDFDYNVPEARFTPTPEIPLPGPSLIPYVQISFYADQPTAIAGEEIVLYWDVTGFYDTLEIDNGIGAIGDFGSEPVNPAASQTYTLTATLNGVPVTAELPITIINPPITDICYADFDSAGDELSLLGGAKFINDHLTILEPGDVRRLRLTEAAASRNGTAWFRKRLDFSEGFDTTFDLHFVSTDGNTGADGISFIIQDNPTGTASVPVQMHENGLATYALNIKFDSYLNAGEVSAAFVQVLSGTSVLATANLANNPDITLGGTSAVDLTQGVNDVPYRIRVTYVPGDLDVYFDGVLIIADVPVDLDTILAVDINGKGFAGFSARTGGAYETHDITSWCLTEGAPVPPAPIDILAADFDFVGDTVNLTFTSSDTQRYRITSSTDGINFPNVLATNIAGASGATQTTTDVSFTQVPFLLLRVEQE